MMFKATEIQSCLPCTYFLRYLPILIVDIGNSNVEPIAGSYIQSKCVPKKTKYQGLNGTVVCMQVLHYDNTGFGTDDLICRLLKRYAIVAIVPTPGRPVLC